MGQEHAGALEQQCREPRSSAGPRARTEVVLEQVNCGRKSREHFRNLAFTQKEKGRFGGLLSEVTPAPSRFSLATNLKLKPLPCKPQHASFRHWFNSPRPLSVSPTVHESLQHILKEHELLKGPLAKHQSIHLQAKPRPVLAKALTEQQHGPWSLLPRADLGSDRTINSDHGDEHEQVSLIPFTNESPTPGLRHCSGHSERDIVATF